MGVRPAANVTIMGVRYPLFTHVHHHYGLNDAFDRSVSALLSVAPSNTLALGLSTAAGAGAGADASSGSSRAQEARPATAHWHAEHRGAAAGWKAGNGGDSGVRSGGISSSAADARSPPAGQGADSSNASALAALAAAASAEQRRAGAGRRLTATDELGLGFAEPDPGSSDSGTWRRLREGGADSGVAGRGAESDAAGSGSQRSLPGEAAVSSNSSGMALAEVAHPCLHAGYERTYARMALQGVQPAPYPPRVRLVGRCSTLHRSDPRGVQRLVARSNDQQWSADMQCWITWAGLSCKV